jgi:2-oxoglutarate dehydrogenase E1 component
METTNYLGNAEIGVVEDLFRQYKTDRNSVDESWQQFFEGFEFGQKNFEEEKIPENLSKEFCVVNLINAYRSRGHLFTDTNPVRERRHYAPTLDIENFGLEKNDLEIIFHAGSLIGIGNAKLKDILAHLKQTYCASIGVEYMYMRKPEVLEWLQKRMEKSRNTPDFSIDEKKNILRKLNEAVVFENFLHTKFVGQKRFSLEGGETLIPAMDMLVEHGSEMGIADYIIGMSHRGRLSVLTNIMHKSYEEVFEEFSGTPSEDSLFNGDVKYHLGFSSDRTSAKGKKIHISLTANPSHLEAVNPVVEGIARAKIDHIHKGDYKKVCPILIHGDAAVAAQGVVYEVVQMSQLDGFKTGGTVHIVVNNQVGFTTNYLDGRSSVYCTDVAKVVLAPVFHVNADDVEAVAFVAQLAIDFRQEFQRDVFIDLLGYRKYGHNEGDEPRFTQPILYKAIAAHPNPKEIYLKKLSEHGEIEASMAKEMEIEFKNLLQKELNDAKIIDKANVGNFLNGQWNGLRRATEADFETSPKTAVDATLFLDLAKKTTQLPSDRKFFSKIENIFKERQLMIEKDTYDWAMGELLAYATLMEEGHQVRFSGQDVERGTFSHRHAIVKPEDSEEEYIPLNHIKENQGCLDIYNSLLSEYAVLGFEYGYAMASPETLTIWEAQFGDFFNGAQIIIDQFLVCGEYKWRRLNGLVLLLPHGYEGQGPEHSSARIERFLQQCAENNIQVINATTPAQQFHALRRQLKRDFRKPLICFTPKKLLRYPACVSSIKDFSEKNFSEVLDDTKTKPTEVKKIAFCSGKIFYDLSEQRDKVQNTDTAIIRIEQLYPFPQTQLNEILEKYSGATDFFWVQEEPENMGPWNFIHMHSRELELKYVGRNESAVPATGFSKMHAQEQQKIIDAVFPVSKK